MKKTNKPSYTSSNFMNLIKHIITKLRINRPISSQPTIPSPPHTHPVNKESELSDQSGLQFASSQFLGTLWRPIETAPRDSTPVDLWVSEDEERLPNYIRVEQSPTNVFYKPVYSGISFVRNATHWMPIPASPNASKNHEIHEKENDAKA